MIGFLVRGIYRVRVKIRIRVRVGVKFKVSVYHWSNCRRSKCTFIVRTENWGSRVCSQNAVILI